MNTIKVHNDSHQDMIIHKLFLFLDVRNALAFAFIISLCLCLKNTPSCMTENHEVSAVSLEKFDLTLTESFGS